MTVHICRPRYDEVKSIPMECFDSRCQGHGPTPHVYCYAEWYGPSRTCLSCGRQSANDGDGWVHVPLDFRKRAAFEIPEREGNIAAAKRELERFLAHTPATEPVANQETVNEPST